MAAINIAGKETEVPAGVTIENAARNAGILPDAYIFMVSGKPVPMDTMITDEMVIKGIKVASGG